jgi:chemotaxis protein methyltransferase WspC
MSVDAVATILRAEIGLDAESIGMKTLEIAVRARAAALGLSEPGAYVDRLRSSSDERTRLVDEIAVPETWFFRYPKTFDCLLSLARKRRAAAPEKRLRFLSAGCATGEEAYSIAMALLDGGFVPSSFTVLAFDVSRSCLERAERGIYSARSVQGKAPGPQHVNTLNDGRLQIRGSARSCTRFVWGNLIDPGLLEVESPFDAVFCRNVMIYLAREVRARCLANLARLLAADGLLFAGSSEVLPAMDPRFRAEIPSAFAFRFRESHDEKD